jgi:hypothetical protein
MSNNKAEQTLDTRLIDRIAALERQVREMSTPQLIGGDVFNLVRYPAQPVVSAVAGPVTLNPDQAVLFYSDYYSDQPALWNFLVGVTVDVNDAAHSHENAGPGGTTGQDFMRLHHWVDIFQSSDSIVGGPNAGRAVRRVCVRVQNYDTVSHNYWAHFAGYIPKLTAEGVI